MIRGTTPTFTLRITNGGDTLDLTQASGVHVTIRQNGQIITKTGDDISIAAQSVSCWLTQEESLSLRENMDAEVQINWTYGDSETGTAKRAATIPKHMRIIRQLYPEVL